MRCPACGKQLPEDPFFCAYCGAAVRSRPGPLPRVALDRGALALALGGTTLAAPVAIGFWLLAGSLAQMPWMQCLALGGLVAVLSGVLGAGLKDQIRWPLLAQPPRCSPRQLALTYGLGSAVAVAPGAIIIGVVVLPLAWGLAVANLPSILAGAAIGLVAIVFALAPATLAGLAAGYGLGQLAQWQPQWAAAWAAALTWWLAGSLGGGVAGAFVAVRSNYALATGAAIGAWVQCLLQVLLLPLATYLVRWYLVLTGS